MSHCRQFNPAVDLAKLNRLENITMQLTYRGCQYHLNSQLPTINPVHRLATYRGITYKIPAAAPNAVLNPTQLTYRGVAYAPSHKNSEGQSIDSLSPWIA
jgi:hypothetical protein